MNALSSPLGRRAPSQPWTDPQIEAACGRAWIEHGIAVFLDLEQISDEWLKQAIKNEMARRHGRRMKR